MFTGAVHIRHRNGIRYQHYTNLFNKPGGTSLWRSLGEKNGLESHKVTTPDTLRFGFRSCILHYVRTIANVFFNRRCYFPSVKTKAIQGFILG